MKAREISDKIQALQAAGELKGFRVDPPDSEGLWWLYGEEEFGTLGGNYGDGRFHPEIALEVVRALWVGGEDGHLLGICKGRHIDLAPFDEENRRPGYLGVWRRVDLPETPDIVSEENVETDEKKTI